MPSCTVVTGAAGALGSAVVRHLAARGHAIAALDRPAAAARLEALAREVEAASGGAPSGRCLGLPVDVTSSSEWRTAVARIEAELGPPTGAALIAGGWRGGTPFAAEADDDVFKVMFTQNLETAHQSLRALVPGMVARKNGSIVVVGSRVVDQPWTSQGAAAYASAKAAVVRLAQAIAAEVLESSVRINAVLPSVLDTPANRSAMPGADPSQWVSPTSLASVIEFLLSRASVDVSGAAIPVYGRA